MQFIHCFQAEWLKKKRSLASWLVFIGAFFTPSILILIKLIKSSTLKGINMSPKFWENHWMNSWESMAIFLLPLGIILSASLITQLEFKNNTWKQWHTTPQLYSTLFFTKLVVIIVMMLQFFVLFNLGLYLSGVIPGLFIKGVPYPAEPIPYIFFLKQDITFFIACLPIIACQYLISLQFKNFLVPVGGGIILWIASVGSLTWKYGYTIPYSYGSLYFLKLEGRYKQDTNLYGWALGYFAVFTLLSYYFYLTKKEKG
jgi:lantibiotic transport system permease protein